MPVERTTAEVRQTSLETGHRVDQGRGHTAVLVHRAWNADVLDRPWTLDERTGAPAAVRNEQAFNQYVQHAAASSPRAADELAKLADLRDRRTISEQEFAQTKARLLSISPTAVAGTPQAGRWASVG